MFYIVTAMYVEAKPIIKKYNLKKNKLLQKFQVFSSEKITLIISGTGKINSSVATTYLLANQNLAENDFILNIGLAASLNKKDEVGEKIIISKIHCPYSLKNLYPEMLYKHNFKERELMCYDKVIEKKEKYIDESSYIDMESFGFYKAASYFFKKDKIIILKIISDILGTNQTDRKIMSEKQLENLDETYLDIFKFLDKFSEALLSSENFFDGKEEEFIKKIRQNLKLSDTMYYDFLNLLRYLKLSNKNIVVFLKDYENIEIKNKLEGKKYFEEIKKRIIEQ